MVSRVASDRAVKAGASRGGHMWPPCLEGPKLSRPTHWTRPAPPGQPGCALPSLETEETHRGSHRGRPTTKRGADGRASRCTCVGSVWVLILGSIIATLEW